MSHYDCSCCGEYLGISHEHCRECKAGRCARARTEPQPTPPAPPVAPQVAEVIANLPSLPDDADKRNEYPMADGLLDYFPNALAEVAKLSFRATQQHHPDQPMHWDRSKSTDHRNKILRHLADTHTVDDKGNDHWAMVCWRALAGYQEYLERKNKLPPSRASRNRPF
jgi:hypothetical protein